VNIPVLVTLSSSEEAVALIAVFCTWAAATSTSFVVLVPHLLRWRTPSEADLRMAKRKSTRSMGSTHSQNDDTGSRDSPPSSQGDKEPEEVVELAPAAEAGSAQEKAVRPAGRRGQRHSGAPRVAAVRCRASTAARSLSHQARCRRYGGGEQSPPLVAVADAEQPSNEGLYDL
jgi:hypothetical protein